MAKIKGADLELLAARVKAALEPFNAVDLERTYSQESQTRFRVDMFYVSKVRVGDGVGMTGDIVVPGCTDAHIETAMKSVLAGLGLSHIGRPS